MWWHGLTISCVGLLIDPPAYVCLLESLAGKQQFPLSILFNHAGQGLGETWGVGGRHTVGLGLLYVSKQATPGCQPYCTHTLYKIQTPTGHAGNERFFFLPFLISLHSKLDAPCRTKCDL